MFAIIVDALHLKVAMLSNESTSTTDKTEINPFNVTSSRKSNRKGALSVSKPSLPGAAGMILRHWRIFLGIYFGLLHVIVYFTLLRSQTHHTVTSTPANQVSGFTDVHQTILSDANASSPS